MTRARFDGLLFFLLGSVLFVVMGAAWEHLSHNKMTDFKGIYYSARCLLEHSDPYNRGDLLRIYQAQGDNPASYTPLYGRVVSTYVHLPNAFIFTAPFGMLPWKFAHILWTTLTAASFIFAAYLMWSLAADSAPVAAGLLICFFLSNSDLLLDIGNAAGISISLCVAAVWCFVRERFVTAGIICLALSIVITPHDAGLIWVYFLLAGGVWRKYAIKTLILTIALSFPGILWISHVAPHWMQELQSNMSTMSMHGDISDPGPAGMIPIYRGALVIDLQTVISLFRDDPSIYNPVTYLLCAPLLLAWAIAVLRKRFSQDSAWLALAAISALSMLPLYHRTHDTRLMLLAVPAFAVLWARGGLTAWLAFVFTGLGAVIIGGTPEQLLAFSSARLRESTHGLPGRLLELVFMRPVPLILLVMGIFYLWAYIKHDTSPVGTLQHDKAEKEPTLAAAI